MKVAVLALDGVFDSGLSVVLDTLATANELAEASNKPRPFEVSVCGMRRSVSTHHGFRVPVTGSPSSPVPSW
jgi:hypothetical protein